jgi:two-component system, NarL family, nitrate/nitrite response regulator NarL
MTHTVLIIEDHPLYRGALAHLVAGIVGEAFTIALSSAEEGLRQIDTLKAIGTIVLDLGLPGIHGIEAINAFKNRRPSVPLIVISASEDRQEASRVLQAGALMFVSKAVSTEILSACVRRVLAGAVLEPEWVTANGKAATGSVTTLKLTPRQQETLVLLAQGYSNKEIGLRMSLAEITVKLHVSSIFRELGVVNRTQAVLVARQLGLQLDAPESAHAG